jgi:hypothetical protein
LATILVRFFVVIWSPFRISWRFPHVSAWPIFMFPAPLNFSLPFVGSVTHELARFSSNLIDLRSFVGFGGKIGCPLMSWCWSYGAWRLGIQPVVRVPVWGLRLTFSPLLSAVKFLCRGLLSRRWRLFLLLSLFGPSAEWCKCRRQAVKRLWRNLVEILLVSESSFLVDCEKLRQSADLRNGLPGAWRVSS